MSTRILSVFNQLKRVGFALLLLGVCSAILADTTWVSGEIGGTWDVSGSPYVVLDTSWVNEDTGLAVEPGVEIVLTTPESRLWLAGNSQMIGTATDSIEISLLASGSQLRSNAANSFSFDIRYCRIESRGELALLSDTVQISNTSYVGFDHPFNGAFISGDYVTLTNSHFASIDVESDTVALRNCTFEYSVRFEDGSVSVDSLVPVGNYSQYASITAWPSGGNKRVQISNATCGSLYLDGTFSPGVQAELENVRTTERFGNSILGRVLSSLSVSRCKARRVRVELSSGAIERSQLYSFAIENTTQSFALNNCVFEIKEECQECYPDGFVTGTVVNNFHLYNNVFVSGERSLPVIFYPTHDHVDAEYNITQGMDDPWSNIVEGCCNFSASNLFDPHSFHDLRFDSPAINTGLIGQPDEDGSRSDIGIDWWDHRYDHPPTITTPDTIKVRWGEQLVFVLSAADEGPVTFPIVPIGPHWLTGPSILDENRDTLFAGPVPFGVNSFDVELGARDQIGQFDRENIHVQVYPDSVLLDTVRGTLTVEHSPYRFSRDIYVPFPDTLRIDPGVVILADSIRCTPGIFVAGTLIAEGNPNDSIIFNSTDGILWDGLTCHTGSRIVLKYVSFRNAQQALYSNEADSVSIENSTIVSPNARIDMYFSNAQSTVRVNNMAFLDAATFGVYDSTHFMLDSCLFDGNNTADAPGLAAGTYSSGIISHCKFTNFATVPLRINSDSIVLERSLIDSIQFSRIITLGASVATGPTIQHNTFVGNGSQHVADLAPNMPITIRNNIFVDLSHVLQVATTIDTNSITLRNNCFSNVNEIINQGNLYWPTIGFLDRLNVNGDSVDFYDNLRIDPEFFDSLYRLSFDSPCIDAAFAYGQGFLGEGPDIGAFEYDVVLFEPWIGHNPDIESGSLSITTFPNPTNAEVTILLPTAYRVLNIQIFNVLGQLRFSTINNASHFFGNRLHLSVSDWATGQYFISTQTNVGTIESTFTIVR